MRPACRTGWHPGTALDRQPAATGPRAQRRVIDDPAVGVGGAEALDLAETSGGLATGDATVGGVHRPLPIVSQAAVAQTAEVNAWPPVDLTG